MVKFAYVPTVPGVVQEVYQGDELFPMHPDLEKHWYLCPDTVEQGYDYDGSVFTSAEATARIKAETTPAVPVEPVQPTNEDYLAQIKILEGNQARAVREFALGRPEALKKLQQIDIDITLLRSKMV